VLNFRARILCLIFFICAGSGWAQSSKPVFKLSEIYRSSFPAIEYKRAFEEDLSFSQKTCFRAMNGDLQISGFSAVNIAFQCNNNLKRLDEIRVFAVKYLEAACRGRSDATKYFTFESTELLCGGYLKEVLLVELEENYLSFSEYRERLLAFAEKCRRRTGDADGC